jgi:carbon-monoxide dehydrogenase large subunit
VPAHFVRSPHAHARIAAIDCTAALKSDGVVAIVTGRELAEWTAPARMAPPIEGLHPVEFTTLPIDKVRFIGDPVACERLPSNLVSRQSFSAGDPARRFSEAEIIVEVSFHQQRQTHAPIETRGCCGVWDQGRRHLTMHIGNQVPHPFRTQLASRMRLTESQVTVACPDIGGAFGQKIALYREELTVAAVAPAGALARGSQREPDRRQSCPRGRRAHARGGRQGWPDSRP